jgi:hypothetical protein
MPAGGGFAWHMHQQQPVLLCYCVRSFDVHFTFYDYLIKVAAMGLVLVGVQFFWRWQPHLCA